MLNQKSTQGKVRWPRAEQLQGAETTPSAGETKESDGASKLGTKATQEARATVDLPRGSRSHAQKQLLLEEPLREEE